MLLKGNCVCICMSVLLNTNRVCLFLLGTDAPKAFALLAECLLSGGWKNTPILVYAEFAQEQLAVLVWSA